MAGVADDKTEIEWYRRNDEIDAVLSRYGQKDTRGKADYKTADLYCGLPFHLVSFNSFKLLQMGILQELQSLLDNPESNIKIMIDIPGKHDVWPDMGVTIYRDKIEDDLRRDLIPHENWHPTFGKNDRYFELSDADIDAITSAAKKRFSKIFK